MCSRKQLHVSDILSLFRILLNSPVSYSTATYSKHFYTSTCIQSGPTAFIFINVDFCNYQLHYSHLLFPSLWS